MTYLRIGKNRHDAGQSRPSAGDDANIFGGILTLPALPVQRVVIRGDLVSELPNTHVRCILDVIGINRQLEAARRGAVDGARLRRPLAHVGPRRVGRRESVLRGPGGGVDDAGLLDVSEHGELGVARSDVQLLADGLGLLGGIAMVLDVHVVSGADGLLVVLFRQGAGGRGAGRAGSSGSGHAGIIYILLINRLAKDERKDDTSMLQRSRERRMKRLCP